MDQTYPLEPYPYHSHLPSRPPPCHPRLVHYWQQHHLEIIDYTDRGEYVEVRVAVDGTPSLPMDVHKSIRDMYPGEDQWLDYLAQSGETMLTLYGDAREPIPLDVPEEQLQADAEARWGSCATATV